MSDIEEAKSGAEPAGAAAAEPFERGMAEVVVGCALLRVLQDLVGLAHLPEAQFRARIAGIAGRDGHSLARRR